jgi:dTDP-4-dehydrorhamnose reductase
MMKKTKITKRNPLARVVKEFRPQVVVSKKAYNRKRQKIDAKRCNMSNY